MVMTIDQQKQSGLQVPAPASVPISAPVPAPVATKKRGFSWFGKPKKAAPVSAPALASAPAPVPAPWPMTQAKKRGFLWWGRGAKKNAPGPMTQAKTAPQRPTPLTVRAARTVQGGQQKTVLAFLKSVADNLYAWSWTKAIVYWLILSAATASDLAFLLSSLWMSINANVHGLVLHYMTRDTAEYLSYLATSAYVGLPIFIVSIAVVQTVGHARMWNTGGIWSRTWTVIFGVPALIFFLMDLVTLSNSVANVTFTMPTWLVVLRADSAFIFAFGSLIFYFLGRPQEADRLAEKDGIIASLQEEMKVSLAALTSEKDNWIASITSEKDRLLTVLRDEKDRIIGQLGNEKNSILAKTGQEKESLLSTLDAKNDEIEALKSVLAQTQRGFSELHKAMNKSEDEALEAYGEDCISWLRSGIKSASPEEIARYTGVSTRRLNNALASGKLKRPANNRGDKVLILVSSLIEWLQQNAPVTERQTDKIPALSNGNGHGKETINLDEYAALPV